MKKIGFIVFVFALIIGVVFSTNCGFGAFQNYTAVQGSGTLKNETRDVSNFKAVDGSGALHMEISVQKEFSVSIETDDNLLGFIKTEVSGDTLKIYTEGKISSTKKINVKISMPELTALDLSGASNALVTSVKTDSLKLKASGASKIKIDGEAKNMESDASGASGIDAEGLRVENADVEVSGASNTTVSATNELKTDASGASTVYYTGEPKNVIQKASGASSVKKK